MNQNIEIINNWGARFLEFAWPMLWQSSLLIVVVLALDRALARKTRAAIRHALWLVVLVKLLLPPTLALPTGVAWWLFPAKHEVRALPKYTVTYAQGTAPVEMPLATVPLPKPPPAQLNKAGWTFLATASVSTALLGWLLFRWIQVAAMVRRATDASGLADALVVAQSRTGSRRRIRLKLVEGRLSPAVCGLFRPVILLPRLLAERLSESQLQAVLLHELIHLRRADIWVNCAQALLQILYWWHPLVWLANGRMRRVREEAVDDAVMLALNDDAGLYAPTLLEVAKLAFHRPSLSLGLVGIMESRSALRQRIERLMDFRAPRHAGLTFASVLVILAFSAVALPMGSAPGPADSLHIDPQTGLPLPPPVANPSATNRPQVFITANLYRMSWADIQKNFSVSQLQPAPKSAGDNFCWVGSPTEFKLYSDTLKSSGLKSSMAPRVVTISGVPAEFFMGNDTNGFWLDCLPVVTNQQVQLGLTGIEVESAGGQSITNRFSENVLVQDHGGFLVYPHRWENFGGSSSTNWIVALVKVQILTNGPSSMSAKPADTNQLYTRVFKVDPVTFPSGLQHAIKIAPGQTVLDNPGTNVSSQIRAMCRLVGVDLMSPPGKAIFYDDRKGMLLVKATSSDLEDIEKIIETLNQTDPQIHLKARFYQIPMGNTDKFARFLVDSNSTGSNITGILTPDNARAVMKALQTMKGAEVLGEPEVVFISGRHVQMRATDAITIVTNSVYVQNPTNPNADSITFQTEKVETGPILDGTASLLADGYTVSLGTVASVIKFWGYADVPEGTSPQTATNTTGEIISLPIIWPVFQTREYQANVNLYDNQTLLMVLNKEQIARIGPTNTKWDAIVAKQIQDREKTNQQNEIVVLVTPTVIDVAGNRVHNDYLDIDRQVFPPQPSAVSPPGAFPGRPPGSK